MDNKPETILDGIQYLNNNLMQALFDIHEELKEIREELNKWA